MAGKDHTDTSEVECDEPPPTRELRKMSFVTARKLAEGYEGCMLSAVEELVGPCRVRLVEVCCSEESKLTAECEKLFGKGSAIRLSWWNGGDIETQTGREYVQRVIRDVKPDLVWISPECGPFSPLQHLNMRTPAQRASLETKRDHARLQYEGAAAIIRDAWKCGSHCVLEMSERCEG